MPSGNPYGQINHRTATSGGRREITAVQTQPEGSIPTAVRTGDNDFNQCKRPLI